MARYHFGRRLLGKVGPVRVWLSGRGISWTLAAGRFKWNPRTGASVDTPGPGWWSFGGRRRKGGAE